MKREKKNRLKPSKTIFDRLKITLSWQDSRSPPLVYRYIRTSIALYYRLTGDKPLTQEEVGEKLAFSGSTISRLNKAAKEKLEHLKKNVHHGEQN